ncbi:hypothetical protein H9P43_007365 [Blastocladiella emersonii ATCC 22665]|nr:hypothetical protein H9P43_007365 [Blastocladiella emersonii ATCC 22665]
MIAAFNLSPEQLSLQSTFTKVAGSNPAMQAAWYLHSRGLVIEHLFGWLIDKGAASDKPGVFGCTRAYFMAEETQARHTLHSRRLLWLVGFPRTTAQWNTYLTNDVILAKYRHCVKTNVPPPVVAVCAATMATYESRTAPKTGDALVPQLDITNLATYEQRELCTDA